MAFGKPEPVAAVVLVPRASPGVVDYTVSVRGEDGVVEKLSARFNTSTSQAWVTIPLTTPTLATEITVDGQSTDSWISLWEVLVAPCM